MSSSVSRPPQFWTRKPDSQGGERLSYAVRGGAPQAVLMGLGVALVAAGLAGAFWLTWGGGLTVAGWIFLVLVPGGAVLAGAYVLDRALLARTDYVLGNGMIAVQYVSLFGARRLEIPRSLILGLVQQYTPPGQGASAANQGDWVTLVEWRTPEGQRKDLAFEGLHTDQERRWLGPLLAEWARMPIRRGFSASAEEADPAELPGD